MQQVGKKSNAGINYEDKTIDWTITVNADKQDLRNFILTDDFAGSGQKLVKDSIEINPAVDSNKVEVNSDNEGFKVDFGDIKDTYTIKYQTEFTYDFDGEKKPDFKNGVNITYETSDGSDYELEFGNTVKPNKETKSNGAKNGNVNQDTKEITWKVDINYNELDLKDAKVEDEFTDSQSFIDGSVKIYETAISKNGKVTKGEDVTDQFTVGVSDNQVEVDFGAIDKSYRIEFKTKDKDGIYNENEEYKNTAQFIPREGEKHNLTANVTLPNQGEFLGKSGTHNKEDWTIDWKIDVNKSLSTTSDFTITDDLGDIDAQILLEDTIKVTRAGSTDELEEGKDYKLTISGNGFEIYIPGEITEAYEVTYSSYIVAEETVDVTNDAEIQSNDVIKGTTDKTESVEIKISTGGGTGEGTTGGLIIDKTEPSGSDGQDKQPIENVVFDLVRTVGKKDIVVRTGTTDNNGKLEWTGLQFGEYTLKETVPEGYLGDSERIINLSSEETDGIKTLPIENTREKGNARIIKEDSFTDELLENAEFKIKNTETKQEFTSITDTEGVILVEVPYGEYTVEEITAPNGYRITEDIPNIDVQIDKTATVTVENVAFVDVEGEKKWFVDDGKELPESITVKLLRNGKETDEFFTTNASKNWEYSFTDLDKYTQADREIEYDIVEVKVDGYAVEQDGYDLTNIQTTDISGTKTWKDDNNPNRPSSITVQLLADGEKLEDKTVQVHASDNWKYAFNELPKYTSDGEEITYTIDELDLEGYDTDIDGFDITNTRANKISITGEKNWKDEDPTDRPDEIIVNLTREAGGEEDKDFNESKTVKPNSKGKWVYEFEDLDEFDDEGVEYTYTIKEDNVPGNYESTVDGTDITNVRVGETEVSGTKRWKDDKVSDRPESIKVDLLRNDVVIETEKVTADDNWEYTFDKLDKYNEDGKYYEYKVKEQQVLGYAPAVNDDNDITNTRSEQTDIEITKGWLDDNSEERPDSVIVYVNRGIDADNLERFDTVDVKSEEDWTFTLTDLEAYNEDGLPYIYELEEKEIEGYESTVDGFSITNLRVGETEVTGEKVWDEVDEQYRPDSVTINLFANDEKVDHVEVSGKTNWTYAFEDLDKYDSQGKEIVYTVKEDEVPAGYESTVKDSNITNKQITTEIAGEKIWLDDLDEHPEITLNLLANDEETGKSLDVSTATDWNNRFTELPKYDKTGEKIEYTVEEEAVSGYETTIEDFVVTNLRVGTTEVNGEKIWKDAGPKDRPDSIDVVLTRNVKGESDTDFEEQLTVTPDAEGNWHYTFEDLPEFNDKGIPYTYTVKEETEPEGYESSVNGYDITNLRVGTVNLSGKKTWQDDNADDRPGSITVNLFRNKEQAALKTKEVTAADDWSYTFTDLPEFDEEGIAYDYHVSEDDVPRYAAEFEGMDITNTRSEQKSIEITKGWLDDNSKDRPKSIEVDLYQNDTLLKTATVKASNDWVYEFADLEAYDKNGEAYTYSIKEHEITGYESKVSGFNITNTRVGIIDVTGEKHWKDEGSENRPESIEVTLTRELKGVADEDFVMTETVTPDSSGNWTYVFEDLPEFDDQGVAYDYQVTEDGVPTGYETSIDGYDITNLRVGTTEVIVRKNWEDDDKESRPMSIAVDLLQNGKVMKSITLSEADGWKYRFTDLPKFDQEGKKYTYTIFEKPIEGYETNIEETDAGFDITNTYVTPEERPERPETPGTPTEPDKPESEDDSGLPKTGQISNLILYAIGGLLVVAGLVVGKRKIKE